MSQQVYCETKPNSGLFETLNGATNASTMNAESGQSLRGSILIVLFEPYTRAANAFSRSAKAW